ncbi:4-(cytidine 5'-diphospho)-2-C-methyl-D-erythritol kinase [Schlegelella sp. S2-27]|uniref:4-diphosphocytidyl-2-C-methyl-D-erythritol kinase n=1 Tax=Caldimonas mangrovi TaxID=2944811 RepID=A0ABT0YIZ5_9BURK|nr:4-(cytidine 5'-diphospho)-2-C-methyl-D-erythritol kinase [Caldimonas mangrovi]MCM5678699.1 4-(cytidine 5'-diphospho)-2-C-methyl-D-erythritol kinase [Caldimonas mangrovi]
MKALYDVPAPAKLNLFLHVLGRRDDGYHLLQSVFVPIDWCDTLHFELRDDGALARHDLGEPLPADDLCLRAAHALQHASGTCWGVDISILKTLPSGAGLGGGSSDAATTLMALNRLWRLGWTRARLIELGARLGADVPFFLGTGPAWVEGIGERLTPVSLPSARYMVVKPPAHVLTKDIFSSPHLVRDTKPAIVTDFLADTGRFGKNDLQNAAQALCSEVGQASRLLEQRYGNSRMTGSGSAVFARIGADEAPDGSELTQLPAGWRSRGCRSLEQHPLRDWTPD